MTGIMQVLSPKSVTKQIQSRAVNNDDFCPAVVMGSLEQSLATWASKTGGTLALAPHNIHIAEGGRDEVKVSKKVLLSCVLTNVK